MPKVVINDCFGGFGLSHAAMMRYAELKGITLYAFVNARGAGGQARFGETPVPYEGQEVALGLIYYYTTPEPEDSAHFWKGDIERDDAALVQVVEELGEAADGFCAKLKIVDVPDDVEWEVQEYDGNEWVAEKHRTWD